MEEFNTASVNLVSDDTRHVFSTVGTKPYRLGLHYFLLIILAVFVSFLIYGFVVTATDKVGLSLGIFAGCSVLFSVLFIAIAKLSRKKHFTHIIVEERGITFLRRNGETVFYNMSQFINLKVTRHYYNGAYTGSSHSLLFKNAKNKQDEVQLGTMDKDLISAMFDDINCMKQYGRFYIPEVKPAVKTSPEAGTESLGSAPIVGNESVAAKAEPDPNFPYGVSPIDGRVYTHDADKVTQLHKTRSKTYLLIMLAMVLAFGTCLAGMFVFSSGKDVSVPFSLCASLLAFGLIICGTLFLVFGMQSKANSANLIKQVEFYSNCIVITSIYYKHVLEIPNIMRILLTSPQANNPKGLRSIKVQMKDGQKIEVNMGKISSKKSEEIFGNYQQFHIDVNTWSSNHGVVCVNDISI